MFALEASKSISAKGNDVGWPSENERVRQDRRVEEVGESCERDPMRSAIKEERHKRSGASVGRQLRNQGFLNFLV